MSPPPTTSVDTLVDHLFRREAGRLVARLVRVLGPQRLDLAEEAVQDAMVQALKSWPFSGAPADPGAWLTRVAHNRALDVLRRGGVFAAKRADVASLIEARLERAAEQAFAGPAFAGPGFAGEIEDDQLRLIFICCHPEIPPDARVALTLKVVCGFSVREIARAFLAGEAAIAQRIARAKKLIRTRALPYEVPEPAAIAARRDSVLKVLYLLFNEGYSPGEGERVIRADICAEAVRLAEAVAAHPVVTTPECHALAALLLLARGAARVAPGQGRRPPAARAPGPIDLEPRLDRARASATSSGRWAATGSPPTTSKPASPPVTRRRRRGRPPNGAPSSSTTIACSRSSHRR